MIYSKATLNLQQAKSISQMASILSPKRAKNTLMYCYLRNDHYYIAFTSEACKTTSARELSRCVTVCFFTIVL